MKYLKVLLVVAAFAFSAKLAHAKGLNSVVSTTLVQQIPPPPPHPPLPKIRIHKRHYRHHTRIRVHIPPPPPHPAPPHPPLP